MRGSTQPNNKLYVLDIYLAKNIYIYRNISLKLDTNPLDRGVIHASTIFILEFGLSNQIKQWIVQFSLCIPYIYSNQKICLRYTSEIQEERNKVSVTAGLPYLEEFGPWCRWNKANRANQSRLYRGRLAIQALGPEVLCDFSLPPIAILQQLLLIIEQLLRMIKQWEHSLLQSERTKRNRERNGLITSWVSVANSKFGPSTMASTGHASWQNPQ